AEMATPGRVAPFDGEEPDVSKYTLHQLAKRSDTTELKRRLENMKDTKGSKKVVNEYDADGFTPLHHAAYLHLPEAVEVLTKCGADVNKIGGEYNATPLHMAAQHKANRSMHVDHVIGFLIENKADVQAKDTEDQTPLDYAVTYENEAAVYTILRKSKHKKENLRLKGVDPEGNTCLHLATMNGHSELIEFLLKTGGVDVEGTNYEGNRPIHLAAICGKKEVVELIADHSPNINVQNKEMKTALHFTSSLGHTEIAKYLLGRNADINCQDKNGYTPLLLATARGHAELVKLLLGKKKKKADVGKTTVHGESVVYLAAKHKRKDVLETLLENENAKKLIDVRTEVDEEKESPLHVASRRGDLEIVKCLLEKEANVHTTDRHLRTPLHCAAMHGFTSIVREIIKHNSKAVNAIDDHSNTALHLAAAYGNNMAVEVLLSFGAVLWAQNNRKQTPLCRAASMGWTRTCSLLLECGADINHQDSNGMTPLHLAADNNHRRVVQLLIGKGAAIKKDNRGWNCLDIAIDKHRTAVSNVIIDSDVWETALRKESDDQHEDEGSTSKSLSPLNWLRGGGCIKEAERPKTPMQKLIQRMPHIPNRVRDWFRRNKDEENKVVVEYNFEFLQLNWTGDTLAALVPCSEDPNFWLENHPLSIMVRCTSKELLQHELTKKLLSKKLGLLGKSFYFFSFLIYVVFLVFFTGFIVEAKPSYMFSNNTCTKENLNFTPGYFATAGTEVVMAFSAINLLKEFLQLLLFRFAYLKSFTNWLEVILQILALLCVVSTNDCEEQTGFREVCEETYPLGSVAIFLTYINLVLYILLFPKLGVFVVKFKDVLKIFGLFFPFFFLVLAAFVAAFHALLQQQLPFADFGTSLVKVFSMMIGELTYDDIFNDDTKTVEYRVISYIFFVLFVIIMSILMMNLLVGLAVGEAIKDVQEMASFISLSIQVDQALKYEQALPACLSFLRYDKTKDSEIITQDEQHKVEEPKNQLDATKTAGNVETVKADCQELRKDVDELKKTSQAIQSMLRKAFNDKGIEYKEEDYHVDDEVEQMKKGLSK
ncbi:hypothetical protein BaRGS_00008880, partial [Batillaria attramentaria]